MAKRIQVGGRIESKEVGGIVTGAAEILDDAKEKKQSVINQETDDELLRLDQSKQDNLTFDNAPTEGSDNPVKSGGVYAADKALSDAIEAILLLIPSAASALNKLVDTAMMNSSISTATATFKGTYNVVTDLSLTIDATHEQIAAALGNAISTADNNDYAFVQIPVSAESTDIRRTERYKFNGMAWGYEYDLNTSGFTAVQWAAINSGITLSLVGKLIGLPTSSELQALLGQKQDTLTFDNIPVLGSTNPVKSGGVYSAINDEKTAREQLAQTVTGIDGRVGNVEEVIPTGAAANNKLVANNSLEAYVTSIIEAITASFTIATADGHINLTLTQTNGRVASITLTSSDIASAQALTALTGRVTTAESNITSLGGRVSTNETDIANLQQLYNNLQKSKPVPVTALPETGQQQGVIYRLAGTTSYSDYMWNGSTWVLMATYNNAIDPRPMKNSQNLVTSGGVYGEIEKLSNVVNNPLIISNLLIDFSSLPNLTLHYGYYRTTDASFVENYSFRSYKIEVNPKEIYSLTGKVNSDALVSLALLLDVNNDIVSIIKQGTNVVEQYTNYLIEIPDGVKYLTLTSLADGNYDIKKVDIPSNSIIKNIVKDGSSEISINLVNGYYRNDGELISNASWKSAKISVSEGEIYSVSGVVNSADILNLSLLLDSNNTPVSIIKKGTDIVSVYTDVVIVIPSGVSYLTVTSLVSNGYDLSYMSVKKFTFPQIPAIDNIDFLRELSDNPLEEIKEVAGYTPIIKKWGFITDSMGSGEMQCHTQDNQEVYLDLYDYSWGQFLCKLCGTEGYNFGSGGQWTKDWLRNVTYYDNVDQSTELGRWQYENSRNRTLAYALEHLKQGYIIALGINDWQQSSIGDYITDVDLSNPDNNANSFAGDYAKIIQKLKAVNPKAYFFCMTIPRTANFAYNDQIRGVASLFDRCYVIDLQPYTESFSSQAYRDRYKLNSHDNPMGYLHMAYVCATYIDWIIRHNWSDFATAALWDTNYVR